MLLLKIVASALAYFAVSVFVVAGGQDWLSGGGTSTTVATRTSGLNQGNTGKDGNAPNSISNDMNQKLQIHVARIERDIAAKDIDDPLWRHAEIVDIDRY